MIRIYQMSAHVWAVANTNHPLVDKRRFTFYNNEHEAKQHATKEAKQ